MAAEAALGNRASPTIRSGVRAGRSNRQDQRVFRARRYRLESRQGIERLVEQLRPAQAIELEVPQPPLVLVPPALAHVQCADEEIAMALEQQMGRQLHGVAIVLSGHGPPARDSFHQLQSYVVHDGSPVSEVE